MNGYSLVTFFLKHGYSIHNAVKNTSEYIDWFGHLVEEEKRDLLEELIRR